ncbi:NAD-dependent epimerase/dehydratase family protein [Streptomyces sp. NPDC002845]
MSGIRPLPGADDTAHAAAGAGTVLVVGGTGFVGGAVLSELLGTPEPRSARPRVSVLSRRPNDLTEHRGTRHLARDLADPRSLRDVCSGIDTVVHAASYVGRDPKHCHAINDMGTRALLDDAERHGVRRFIYVSTASVYGSGPHRGPDERALEPAPASPASASRLRAEEAVRAAGGTVLRPHLIHGDGDRWFIPALARLLRLVPAWPAVAASYSSMIAVEDLARIVAALVRRPEPADAGAVYHCAYPRPVSMPSLVRTLHSLLRLPEPRLLPPAEHRELVKRAVPDLSEHQYTLLTRDHWYDSGKVWRRTGQDPGPGFEERFTSCPAYQSMPRTIWASVGSSSTPASRRAGACVKSLCRSFSCSLSYMWPPDTQ